MSENLASRVKRLVSGSVNSLVDAVENASPDMVMGPLDEWPAARPILRGLACRRS